MTKYEVEMIIKGYNFTMSIELIANNKKEAFEKAKREVEKSGDKVLKIKRVKKIL